MKKFGWNAGLIADIFTCTSKSIVLGFVLPTKAYVKSNYLLWGLGDFHVEIRKRRKSANKIAPTASCLQFESAIFQNLL